MRTLAAALMGALCLCGISSQSLAASTTDWSGLYAGVGVGYAFGDGDWTYINANMPAPNPQNLSGAVAAVHAIAQEQWGGAVVGLEAQALATGLTGSAICPNDDYTCNITGVGPVVTVAPRIGFAWGNMLAYGTGGYAGANVMNTTNDAVSGVLFESGQAWHNGWVAGGGVDWQASPNVVFGVQYLHVSLDDAMHVFVVNTSDNNVVSATVDTVTARVSYKFH